MSVKNLEERIASLERSNRRWRYCATLLALAAGTVAAAKPDVAESIRTRKLEVVNDRDTVVATVWATGDGGAIALYDEDAERFFGVSGSNKGATLDLQNTEKGTSTMLHDTSISVGKLQGRQRVTLIDMGMADSGGGVVAAHNPFGKLSAQLGCSNTNVGLVQVCDPEGKVVRTLSAAR